MDFIGPEPPALTFTTGQSVGDIRCANVAIPDDSIPQGERSFRISIGDGGDSDGGGEGVRVNPNLPSIDIVISLDLDDGKKTLYRVDIWLEYFRLLVYTHGN